MGLLEKLIIGAWKEMSDRPMTFVLVVGAVIGVLLLAFTKADAGAVQSLSRAVKVTQVNAIRANHNISQVSITAKIERKKEEIDDMKFEQAKVEYETGEPAPPFYQERITAAERDIERLEADLKAEKEKEKEALADLEAAYSDNETYKPLAGMTP